MLLLFDLDGTLFKAKPVLLHAAQSLLRELGAPVPDDGTILKNAGRDMGDFLRGIIPVGEDVFLHALTRYPVLLRDAVYACGELFPGAADMLSALHGDGHELVICSKSDADYIDSVLDKTGIAALFGRRYSTAQHSSKAELFREITGPQDAAVVIGDTFPDINAALETRLASVAAMYGYGNKQKLQAATTTADSPADIYACVRRLCEYSEHKTRPSERGQVSAFEGSPEFLRYIEHTELA